MLFFFGAFQPNYNLVRNPSRVPGAPRGVNVKKGCKLVTFRVIIRKAQRLRQCELITRWNFNFHNAFIKEKKMYYLPLLALEVVELNVLPLRMPLKICM